MGTGLHGLSGQLAWDRRHAHEIIGFGKWIFLSTAIYFAAISFDRFYFVAVLPLALAGSASVMLTVPLVRQIATRRRGASARRR